MGGYGLNSGDREDVSALHGSGPRASASNARHPEHAQLEPWTIRDVKGFMGSHSRFSAANLGKNSLHRSHTSTSRDTRGLSVQADPRQAQKRSLEAALPSASDSEVASKKRKRDKDMQHLPSNRLGLSRTPHEGGTSTSPIHIDNDSETDMPKHAPVEPEEKSSSDDEIDLLPRNRWQNSQLQRPPIEAVASRYFRSTRTNGHAPRPSASRVNDDTPHGMPVHSLPTVVVDRGVPWQRYVYGSQPSLVPALGLDSGKIDRTGSRHALPSSSTGNGAAIREYHPVDVEDVDEIQDFSSPLTRGDVAASRHSPSFHAIKTGNTSAKTKALLYPPGPEGEVFIEQARAQQQPSKSRVTDRMKGKRNAEPHPTFEDRQSQDFARLHINDRSDEPPRGNPGPTTEIVDMTGDDDIQEVRNGDLEKLTVALRGGQSNQPAPLAKGEASQFLGVLKNGLADRSTRPTPHEGQFAPPADDDAMNPAPLKNSSIPTATGPKGERMAELPIMYMYIGRWKIGEDEKGKSRVGFNHHLFRLQEDTNFLFAVRFADCKEVKLSRPGESERICIVELPSEQLEQAGKNCPPRALELGDRDPTTRSIFLKISGGNDHGRFWEDFVKRFKGNKPEFLDSAAIKVFKKRFDERAQSRTTLLQRSAPQPQSIIPRMNNPPRPRPIAAQPPQMSKPSGTRIPVPKVPTFDSEVRLEPVTESTVMQRLATSRETRSSAALAAKGRDKGDRAAPTRAPAAPVETRRVATRASARRRSPSPDPTEVMIGGAGVHITRSDLKRMGEGEFLNDTLIEFGLQQWQKEFSEQHPDLAKDVHVFNSFFFKKLNNKNHEAGYESVRKWTSKVDIFSKKYIIVPINEHLHWYLAIICYPQYILKPSPSLPPAEPRKSKRLNALEDETGAKNAGSSPQTDLSADEAEVENLARSPTEGDAATPAEDVLPPDKTDAMDVDGEQADAPYRSTSVELGIPPSPVQHDNDLDLTMLEDEERDTKSGEAADEISEEETRIFTFDSLSGRHPTVINALKRYLKAEAKDKKGMENASDAAGKMASVPTQKNFCDCGLYLIHFVEKFFENPEEMVRKLSARYKRNEMPDKDLVWDAMGAKEKRRIMTEQIEALASAWKKQQTAEAQQQQGQSKDVAAGSSKEKQGGSEKQKEASVRPVLTTTDEDDDDDDDEVLVVGESKTKQPTPKGRGAKKKQEAPVLAKDKVTGRRSIMASDFKGQGSSQDVEIVETSGSKRRVSAPATRTASRLR